MPVGLVAPEKLLPVPGIRLAAVAAGIRNGEGADLVALELASTNSCAAVFTKNQFCAAPVELAKRHLQENTSPRYLLINAGNANAGTGVAGLEDAQSTCQFVAEHASVSEQAVLPFSTGVIGQRLPLEKIRQALPNALESLSADNWLDAAKGIMTTDTVPKGLSKQVSTAGGVITVTGIAKGSGMICPDMATMLGFIATDAEIEPECLQGVHSQLVQQSFNRVSVDGDTSTNDAAVLVASGSGPKLSPLSPEWPEFEQALLEVYQFLAQAIVRDGEGVSKFVTINVVGARNEKDGELVARTVAHSPLVKTALYASDANWGRILAAVGRAGVDLSIDKVSLTINGERILTAGAPDPAYTEEAGATAMSQGELIIDIELGLGSAEYTLWTCDLSHDYVTINAEYRT